MKTESELNEMILSITNKIGDRDPELLKYLNEMPITVPNQEFPEITVKTLSSYYDSLVVLFEEYELNHSKDVQLKKVENLQSTKIINFELDNSYQNLFIKVNNISISYNDEGEGNIPVLFLHGFPFDKSMWKCQLDSLRFTYRVIACDIRGFGKSTDEKTPLSIDLFSEDLVSFMDKLNIDKAIICGLSMGGYICINAIKRFPERFVALILCDTQCIADTADVKENRCKAIEQINLNGTGTFNEKFIKSVFHPDTLKNKTELFVSLRNIVFANSNNIIIAGLIALANRSETCSTLSAIRIPTLIICGREDEVIPLVQSEYMHRQIEGSRLKIIDNAAHVSNLDQPDVFNNYLHDFLNSLNTVFNL